MMRKKLCLCIASLMLAGAWSCQALDYDQHFARGMRVYRVSLGVGGTPSAADMHTIYIRPGDMVANADDDTLFIMSTTNVYTKIESDGTVTVGALAPTSMTVSGKLTANGEVEINGAAGVTLDINMVTNANLITIDQTAVAGTATTNALIAITDARTGATADEAAEATVVITSAGVYGLSVADGIVNIESLTASLPVFTDGSKGLVSGTTALAWTNATAAVSVIGGDAVVTNATAGGGVFGGITLAVTNIILYDGGPLYDSTGAALTNAAGAVQIIITNVTLETGTPTVSSPTITLESGAVTATSALTEETATFAKP